ncbi:hypothetical protein KAU33_11805 [Candidatus Dependentiae bacterium]|nr:hypothetical protein [Candidatus Dependentiae bacterium]
MKIKYKLILLFLSSMFLFSGCIETLIQVKTTNHYTPYKGLIRTTEFIETKKDVTTNDEETIVKYYKTEVSESKVKKGFNFPAGQVETWTSEDETLSLHFKFENEFSEQNKYPPDVQRYINLNGKINILHENQLKIKKKKGFFKTIFIYEERYPAEIIIDKKIETIKILYSKWTEHLMKKVREEKKATWSEKVEEKIDNLLKDYKKRLLKSMRLLYKALGETDKEKLDQYDKEINLIFKNFNFENEFLVIIENTSPVVGDIVSFKESQDRIAKILKDNDFQDQMFEIDLFGAYTELAMTTSEYKFENRFNFKGKLLSTNGKPVMVNGDNEIVWNFESRDFFLFDYIMKVEFEVINYGQIFSLVMVALLVIILLFKKAAMKKAAIKEQDKSESEEL